MKTSPISSNNQINFTSTIKWTNGYGFKKELEKLSSKLLVNEPFTRKEIVRAKEAYSKDARICTAGGIVVKNKKGEHEIVMFHLDPEDIKNLNIKRIIRTISKKIGKDKPVNAFLFGGKMMNAFSVKLFDGLESFIQKLGIPCTEFKGTPLDKSGFDLAFNGAENELTVRLTTVNFLDYDFFQKRLVPKVEKIVISPTDNVVLDPLALLQEHWDTGKLNIAV